MAAVESSAAGAAGCSAGGSQLKSSIATSVSIAGVCGAAFAFALSARGWRFPGHFNDFCVRVACGFAVQSVDALGRCGGPSHWRRAAGALVTACLCRGDGTFGASAFAGGRCAAPRQVRGATTATAGFGAADGAAVVVSGK